jgi:hypothetical protein
MHDGELFKLTTQIRHPRRGMRARRPLDQRREGAIEWHRTVARNGNQPGKSPARDRHDLSRCSIDFAKREGQIGNASYPMNEPRSAFETRAHPGIIEAEPTRPLRRDSGVWGNDFEEYALAKLHQVIMRSHQRVRAAKRQCDAQRAPDVGDAFFECQSRDREMIEASARPNHAGLPGLVLAPRLVLPAGSAFAPDLVFRLGLVFASGLISAPDLVLAIHARLRMTLHI